MEFKLLFALLVIFKVAILLNGNEVLSIVHGDSKLILTINTDENVIELNIKENTFEKFSATLGVGLNISTLKSTPETEETCFSNDIVSLCININNIDRGFNIVWKANTDVKLEDCYKLNQNNTSWFGGTEIYEQNWPIERMVFNDYAYILNGSDNGAVKENYWLSSKGAYIYVEKNTPLFINQNSDLDDHICYIAEAIDPYINRNITLLNYTLVPAHDPKTAHYHAVENYLGKGKIYPNKSMIREPIWTTWAKFKKEINDEIVLNFAKDVKSKGYNGQIEIDDDWETCYGSLIFNDEKFKNITSTVKTIKDMGFRVTLWVHPFVNSDCEEAKLGKQKGYFLKDKDGNDLTNWWNGKSAHHIDFSKTEAKEWYVSRLKRIQNEHGIDNFKFDAGESSFTPKNSIINSSANEWPNKISEDYIRTCALFGDLLEVRSGWNTQDLGIFVRMLDKDSRWGLNNGLHSLITTLLQMNIAGYSFVLPDMIGGNGYDIEPTPELLVRWAQANTFMPAMQFSYLPWDIVSTEFDVQLIVKKFVDLHMEYANETIKAMEMHILNGTPVNPPVWWIDPTNEYAHTINDEYLLGENILVAPVIKEGAITRDIFLPSGIWKDGNYGNIYHGNTTIKDYPAPIHVLPWFIRQVKK